MAFARLLTAALVCSMAFIAPAAAQPGCDGLSGTVGANQTCRVHVETATYTIDISYPLEYPDQQALSDFVAHERDRFVDFMAQTRPRDFPYRHELTPHSYSTSGTRSVVFDVYDDTGAHPVTGFHAFNYDLGRRSAVTLDTLFKPGADPVATLDPIVQRFMDKRYDGPAPHNTLGAKAYQNFAITDDAIIFYIGQGMWLPEVDGPQQVSVPRSELASVLT